jgi:UDP-GlcNAc:undecaprenyl-phosphate GlcNAc-1-phosphate transferase
VPSGASLTLAVLQTFLMSAGATWLVRQVARRRGWLAPLRPDRWHREPTAQYGGVGIFAGLVGGLVVTLPPSRPIVTLMALTGVMFFTGLLDDARDLRPQTKVVLQMASGLLLYVGGYHFNDAIVWWVDLAVVVLWVVAITNAMNLLDNMNGLAAGTAVIAGASRLVLFHQTGNAEGAMASAVFIGAVTGFLVFNFPRASIFMGDSGSFTIGFALAALNLSSSEAYSKTLFSILVFPALALALPIFDTAFVSMARYFSGRAISQGGRDHASHRLVAIGLGETTAVVILWAISAVAGAVAFLLYNVGFSYAIYGATILLLGLALFGIVLARVRVYPEGTEPAGPASASGFPLPGELLFKRLILWTVLDAVTTVLALAVMLELNGFGADSGLTLATPAAGGRPAALALSVAAILLGLFAAGLYRGDWQQFGPGVLARLAAGVTVGLLATAVMQRLGNVADPWGVVFLAKAWAAVALSLGATRLGVRVIDGWLHLLGARARG